MPCNLIPSDILNDEFYCDPNGRYKAEIQKKEPTQMTWYKCATCGNGYLDYTKPTNNACGGCDNPDWRIAKYQQAYR